MAVGGRPPSFANQPSFLGWNLRDAGDVAGPGDRGRNATRGGRSGQTKWLDQFDTVDAVLSPGSATWTCHDSDLQVTVILEAQPLEQVFGFLATADVTTTEPKEVVLTWVFGTPPGNNQVSVKGNYAQIQTANASPYTRAYGGLTEGGSRIGKGIVSKEQERLVTWSDTVERPLALLESSFKAAASRTVREAVSSVSGAIPTTTTRRWKRLISG